MRKTLLVALALGLSVAVITPMVHASGPDVATIDCNKKGKKVEGFKHAEHAKRAEHPPAGEKEKGCKVCHHSEEKSCCDCHKEKAEGKAPSIKDAMHKNCIDCHKAAGKGPAKKCDECHGK